MGKDQLDVGACKGEGKSALVSKRLSQAAGVPYLYTPVNMMKRFISSSPKPQPPTQKTSSAT